MRPISRDEFYREATFLASRRGTCSRLQVGAIAVDNGRIVASGYNGSPSGVSHCIHLNNDPCLKAVHAEANLISFSAKKGLPLEGLDLYCTDSPCLKCAQLIINAGFKSVTYYRHYRLTEGIDLLKSVGISVNNLEEINHDRTEDKKKETIQHHPI